MRKYERDFNFGVKSAEKAKAPESRHDARMEEKLANMQKLEGEGRTAIYRATIFGTGNRTFVMPAWGPKKKSQH